MIVNMKYFYSILLASIFLTLIFASCQSESSKSSAESKTVATPTRIDSSVLHAVAKVLSECQKVEYVLYNHGITFETQSVKEMRRFFNYIRLEKANLEKCPTSYDGGVVFKDMEGDIKMAMELNIVPECKRVVFNINNQTYHQVFDDKGIELFKEIIRMRQGG